MLLAGGSASAHRKMSFSGIALIGLRGAGKSTLGKMLAKKIGWSFVELNKEIEAQNGLSVAEIIALYGQEGFRRMEQAALGQLLARKELMVLATGGGIVSEPLTFDLILSSFYTIWLKAEPEEHMARVRGQGDLRPMADDRSAMAELRNILVSREPLYARASAVVDTAGLSVNDAASRLVDAVAPVLHERSADVRPAQRGFVITHRKSAGFMWRRRAHLGWSSNYRFPMNRLRIASDTTAMGLNRHTPRQSTRLQRRHGRSNSLARGRASLQLG